MNSIIKRCSAAGVLALAVLMPDFRLLNISPEGLALIADLEGCRLSPYRCSAGVWTSGIGHTSGVVPGREITEREAAANLVADVMNVERRLAVCAPVEMPPRVYDAMVSFAFNVGIGLPAVPRWCHSLSVNSGRRRAISLPAGCTSMGSKMPDWKTVELVRRPGA